LSLGEGKEANIYGHALLAIRGDSHCSAYISSVNIENSIISHRYFCNLVAR